MFGWVVAAAVGIVATLTVTFWAQLVEWANTILANWLADQFGADLRDAFLLALAGADRSVIMVQRAVKLIETRLLSARLLFRQLRGGQTEKVIEAEVKQDSGEVVTLRTAELVPWHELPDDVREKFIRRQSASVQMELKIKD